MTKVRKRGVILGVGIPAIVLALFLISRLATGDDATVISATTAPPVSNSAGVAEGETECPKADGTQEKVASFASPMKKCIDESKSYSATFDTTEGEIVVELNTASVPGTVNNFVALSRYKYYDGPTKADRSLTLRVTWSWHVVPSPTPVADNSSSLLVRRHLFLIRKAPM